MDGEQFDVMTRLWGTASRRQLLRTFVAAGVGGVLGLPGPDEAAAKCGIVGAKCKTRRCCTGARCKHRRCTCKVNHVDCDGDGRCEDLQTDVANCGGCGITCAAGNACNEGQCTCVPLQGICSDAAQCCGQPGSVDCRPGCNHGFPACCALSAPCTSDCDCCGIAGCDLRSGHCVCAIDNPCRGDFECCEPQVCQAGFCVFP